MHIPLSAIGSIVIVFYLHSLFHLKIGSYILFLSTIKQLYQIQTQKSNKKSKATSYTNEISLN